MTDTTPLTDERLAEIDNSIPLSYDGPWTYDLDDDGRDWAVLYAADQPQAGLVCTVPDYGMYLAEFIAGARTAVPELLAEVRRLRAAEACVREQVATEIEQQIRTWEGMSDQASERARGMSAAASIARKQTGQ